MPQKINLIGKRFSRLVVIREVPERKNNHVYWMCKCDCGNEIVVSGDRLRGNYTKSCGCLKRETASTLLHSLPREKNSPEKNRLYRIWKDMRRRTVNPKRRNYYRYGGRGIRVCEEWFNSYSSFEKWATGNGYGNDLSIDRIDPNGNYCPENCRWVSKTEQLRNKENTRTCTRNGVTKTLVEWSEITGIPYSTLVNRQKSGYSEEMMFKRGHVWKKD